MKNSKVTILGASGGIGQPLALFLKKNSLVTCLALYDVAAKTMGIAEDLSHINNHCTVQGHIGKEGLKCALNGSDIVVIAAGVPRKPGMSRQDLFKVNARLIVDLASAIVQFSPKAHVAVITNPINSLVPIATSVFTKFDIPATNRIYGVTKLDLVRASTFVGKEKCMDPASIVVPVIGGHSGTTIVPLLSQCEPKVEFNIEKAKILTKMIQVAGTHVVVSKAGAGSATLSTAYAASLFVNSLLLAIEGEPCVADYAYVYSSITEVPFFASPVLLGPDGIVKVYDYGCVNDYEKQLIEKAIPELRKNIQEGLNLVMDPCFCQS